MLILYILLLAASLFVVVGWYFDPLDVLQCRLLSVAVHVYCRVTIPSLERGDAVDGRVYCDYLDYISWQSE